MKNNRIHVIRVSEFNANTGENQVQTTQSTLDRTGLYYVFNLPKRSLCALENRLHREFIP